MKNHIDILESNLQNNNKYLLLFLHLVQLYIVGNYHKIQMFYIVELVLLQDIIHMD